MTEKRPRAAESELREAAVDTLSEAFARDAISVEEFERRVELAHRAETEGELRLLLSDLERPKVPVPAQGREDAQQETTLTRRPRRDRTLAEPVHRPEQGFAVGVLGAAERKGAWLPARYNYAVAFWGGVELDFRDCVLPAGEVTELRCFACMAGIEVVVPPDVIVETSGVGIMGGFEHVATDADPPPGAPILRLTGLAMMAGVEIKVRYPGESAKEAKQRRKLERKARRERRRLEG